MQLTKHTDYAFRVLIYLATMDESLTTIQTITTAFNLSKSHLMKIVQKLSKHGWVSTIRGKNGGLRLAVDPDEINVKDVVVLMEQTLEPVNCAEPLCGIVSVCKLKHVLWQGQNLYLEHLNEYSLGDLINKEIANEIRFMRHRALQGA